MDGSKYSTSSLSDGDESDVKVNTLVVWAEARGGNGTGPTISSFATISSADPCIPESKICFQ
jgi:hypothetical protein